MNLTFIEHRSIIDKSLLRYYVFTLVMFETVRLQYFNYIGFDVFSAYYN